MSAFRRLAPVLVIATLAAGCGPSRRYTEREDVAKEMIAIMNEYADALESVKDRETARTAATKLNRATDRLEAVLSRKDSIPRLTEAEHDQLIKEYRPGLDAAKKRFAAAVIPARVKSAGEPAFLKAMLRIVTLGQKSRSL